MRNNVNLVKRRSCEALDMSNDYTLPDYITDVKRLVKCETSATLHNVIIKEGVYCYEGEVTYSILMICDDNSLKNIIFAEDFSINSSAPDKSAKIFECRVETSTARLTSPRKINCKAKLILSAISNISEDIGFTCNGEGMPESAYTLETKDKTLSCLEIYETRSSGLHASRDIEISTDKEEIANIIYCKADIAIVEQKQSEGKLYLRGESLVNILYETVDTGYRHLQFKNPFNDVIEDDITADGYMTMAEVGDIKVSASNNSFGEMRLIELDYNYDIINKGYIKRSFEVTEDLYSTEYDSLCTTSTVEPLNLEGVFTSSVTVSEARAIKELTDEELSSVIYCCPTVADFNVGKKGDDSYIIISGNIKYDVICKTSDAEANYCALSFLIPFKYEREIDRTTEELYEEHSFKLTEFDAVIDKERLICTAQLQFSVMTAKKLRQEYISGVEFKKREQGNNDPVIIYYPKGDESLWDIAKRYGSSCSDIKSTNHLHTDDLKDVRVLLLPKKKKRAVFKGII